MASSRTEPTSRLEQFAELYRSTPLVRALVQLLAPWGLSIGSALDTALVGQWEKIREERARTLFDELAKGSAKLTPELIQSEDFLHAYFATVQAAIRTRQREKIRWFARLLLSAAGDSPRVDLRTEFEDYLHILDELTFREITILVILAGFEATHPHLESKPVEMENDLQRATRFWDTFEQTVAERLSIPLAEVRPLLMRLNRTGAYEIFTGGFYGYSGGKGTLTPIYYRLADLILTKDGQSADLAPGEAPDV